MKLAIYMGSLLTYAQMLRDWRAQGMPGLEMKAARAMSEQT
jgi:hypothetical protein